jgi:hypothetical protein
VRTLLRRSTGREVETSGPPAEICSCNFGIPAAMAEDCSSFPVCPAIQAPAEICSCNFGIPAIHGGEKKGRVRGP